VEHLQNLDNVFADVERAGANIAGEKSDWCWNRVKNIEYVGIEVAMWFQASEVDKVWNWPWCENCTECRLCL
jgi:hypothetical protein